jgi:hypothetical protein
MCKKMPTNRDEFLGVVGVGEVKADRYGEEFLEIIKAGERVEATPPPEGKLSFYKLSAIIRERYLPTSEEVTISQIADQLNVILAENNLGRITAAVLNTQLVADDYLNLDDNNKKIPSEKGSGIGIRVEKTIKNSGEVYIRTTFDENAQAAVLESLLVAVREKFYG